MSFRNPFPRPWMEKTGAAAAVGGSSVGLKGIVAGKYRNCKAVQVWLPGGKRLPQSWWIVECCAFDIDMQTRNVKVERLEICVERRPGRNLYQQLRGRNEEKPVIMMTLGLAYPNVMSHCVPLCVSCISSIFHISHLYSVVVLPFFFHLIRLQGFDSYQIVLNFAFPYHIVTVLRSTHHSLYWWPWVSLKWECMRSHNGWMEEWMDGWMHVIDPSKQHVQVRVQYLIFIEYLKMHYG